MVRRFLYPLVAFLFSAALAHAALTGYVVKVEGDKVFLDLNRASGALAGQNFTIFTEGEMLKHPVTGTELGPVEQTVASGRIVEVHDNYSLGEVAAPASPLKPGQKVRLDEKTQEIPQVEPKASAAQPGNHEPYYRSPPLDMKAVDLAVGDVNGDGFPEVVVADGDSVRAYAPRQDQKTWQPVCSFTDHETAPQILSIETADLDKDGKQEVFVTLNNKFFNRVESYVLACKDGKFVKTASLPWMIRSFYGADGAIRLAAQQLIDDNTFPFSNIYALRYEDGKYGPSKERIKYKRLEWIYGFGLGAREGGAMPIFYNNADHIRIQFDKDSWSSSEAYGQTSNRVRWRERMFEFHPRLIVDNGADGLAGVYALKNIPRFGSMAEAFGMFSRAELHYLRWNGLSLEPAWSGELSGYASGLAQLNPNGRPRELAVAVVGATGKTSIWFFRP